MANWLAGSGHQHETNNPSIVPKCYLLAEVQAQIVGRPGRSVAAWKPALIPNLMQICYLPTAIGISKNPIVCSVARGIERCIRTQCIGLSRYQHQISNVGRRRVGVGSSGQRGFSGQGIGFLLNRLVILGRCLFFRLLLGCYARLYGDLSNIRRLIARCRLLLGLCRLLHAKRR